MSKYITLSLMSSSSHAYKSPAHAQKIRVGKVLTARGERVYSGGPTETRLDRWKHAYLYAYPHYTCCGNRALLVTSRTPRGDTCGEDFPAKLQAPYCQSSATNRGHSKASEGTALEGSLGKEREPWSVQVDVLETEISSIIRLRDAGGVFLEVPPDESDEGDEATTSLDETEETEVREGRGNGSPGRETRNSAGSCAREDNGAGDRIVGDDAEEYEPHGGGEGVER